MIGSSKAVFLSSACGFEFRIWSFEFEDPQSEIRNPQ
jgi:hypothetical protein